MYKIKYYKGVIMLSKIFIKNCEDCSNNEVRFQYAKLVGILGIITNLFLSIIKIVIGLMSNSISIITDAVNSSTDFVLSVFTIVGFKLSNKKPTKNHPYGYARYEYVCGFVISLSMFLVGLMFAKKSFAGIYDKETPIITSLTYIVLIISIIIKYVQMKIYMNFSNKINSKVLSAISIDSRNDIISSIGILLSTIFVSEFNINIDGYIGLLVSIIVIYSSIKMIKEVLNQIIGSIPDKDYVIKIKEKLLSYEYIEGIHDLVIHDYGVNNNFVTVHVEMNSNINMLFAHSIIDNIESEFKKLGIYLTIHIDPIVVGNFKIDKLKCNIKNILKNLDSDLDIYDFRIVDKSTHTDIIFSCVVPYEKEYSSVDITNYLKKSIIDEEKKYCYEVKIDRPFY